MELPLISIIIPAYNVEDYIEQCMRSVLNQTYQNLEVIIINDGSSDTTVERAKSVTLDDERFIYIDKENEGQSVARNVGLDRATGEYIFFLDADDFLFDSSIEMLYHATRLMDADIAIGSFARFADGMFYFYPDYTSGEILTPMSPVEAIKGMDDMGDYTLLRYSALWGKLYKSHLFESMRLPQGKYAEDQFVLWKLYLEAKNIVAYNRDIYSYRINPKGLTQVFDKSYIHYVEALEERIAFFKDHPDWHYPLESTINQYRFALNRNIELLSHHGYVDEVSYLQGKLENIQHLLD